MLLHYARPKPDNGLDAPAQPLATPNPPSLVSRHLPGQTILRFLSRSVAPPETTTANSLLGVSSPEKIRGLILDADLLISNSAAWCRSLALLLAHVGCDCVAEIANRNWRSRQLADVFRGRRELGDVLEEFLRSLPLASGRRDEVFAASLAQWREGHSPLHLLPGARQTLRRIAATGAKLALVADTAVSGHELESQLAEAGLGDVCLTVISSVDLDRVMPSPEFLQTALYRLHLDADEVLFVAEEPPPINAAIHAGRLACSCRSSSLNFDAHWRASRLEELLPLFQPAGNLARAG